MGIKRHRPEEIVTKLRRALHCLKSIFLTSFSGHQIGPVGPPQKKWSTFIVSLRRIKDGDQAKQTRGNSDEAAAG